MINVNKNGSYTDPTRLMRYNGSSWLDVSSVKRYNGTSWQLVWPREDSFSIKNGIVSGVVAGGFSDNYIYRYTPKMEMVNNSLYLCSSKWGYPSISSANPINIFKYRKLNVSFYMEASQETIDNSIGVPSYDIWKFRVAIGTQLKKAVPTTISTDNSTFEYEGSGDMTFYDGNRLVLIKTSTNGTQFNTGLVLKMDWLSPPLSKRPDMSYIKVGYDTDSSFATGIRYGEVVSLSIDITPLRRGIRKQNGSAYVWPEIEDKPYYVNLLIMPHTRTSLPSYTVSHLYIKELELIKDE